MTNSVPEKLGKYKIIEEVGRGGFAAVYKAVDTTLERTVALKVLAPHLLWDPTFVQRFQREAKVAANLDHSNIVTIYEVGQMEGVYFIAMQFLEGRTLGQVLEAEGPLPISQVQAVMEQLASALDYAHAREFVHRDIKPSNIMVADDGRATLTDFGLVKAGEGTQLTASGMVFGTPEYMSPEQAEGKALDARSDIYSLGVVLYEMLAGRAPFVADTTPAVMYKHVHEPPPLEELPSDLPQGLVAVVEKALAKKREERYQNAGEMARALEEAIEASARVTPIPPERKVPVSPPVVEEVAPPLVEPEAVVREEPEPPTPKAAPKKALGRGVLLAGGLVLLCCIVSIIILAVYWPPPTPTPEPPTAAPAARVTTPAPTTVPTTRPTPVPPTDTPTPSVPPGMVYVPAGEFTMGSDDDDVEYALQLCSKYRGGDCERIWFEDEQPVHTVYLDAFYIDETEVTNAQFAAFVSATDYETDAEQTECGFIYDGDEWNCVPGVDWQHPFGPDTDLVGRDEHPVVQVSWNDAKAYCEWAGARLPTEAEWEKAARGTDRRTYPWGNTFDSGRVNFCDQNCEFGWKDTGADDGYAQTAPVGSYPQGASPYGALDMAGNVWEWVADWYGEGYYSQSPGRNPPGPDSSGYRVVRGSSWFHEANDVRGANRSGINPDVPGIYVGFRCARGSQ
jgi:serine/threonine-protein kinase